MGKFHDYFDSLDDSVQLPDGFKEEIVSAYDEDFAGANAKVDQISGELGNKDAEIANWQTKYNNDLNAAKAVNFDLMRQVPSNGNKSSIGELEDDPSGSSDITINDLFRSKSK